jgi:hypothetical protein
MSQELEERISNALSACSATQKSNVPAIAWEFDITSSILRGRLKGHKSRNDRILTNKVLDPEQEKALILWIDTLD